MCDVVQLIGDRVGLREVVLRLILPIRKRHGGLEPWRVNRGVNADIADVNAPRAQILGKALGEDALRRLGRREGRPDRDAPERRSVAGLP